MNKENPAISDEKIDLIISYLLRAGVVISSLIVVAGGCLHLIRHGKELPNYHVFYGEPSQLRSVLGILKAASTSSGLAIIQLGLLLLIATPVIRVAFTVVSFIIQKDKVYVGITLIVLLVLLLSLAGGVR